MNRFIPNCTPWGQTRREFLWQVGGGFAGLALADLMAGEARAASPLAEKKSHFAAKAKHCVFLFMNGGPSQVDTFEGVERRARCATSSRCDAESNARRSRLAGNAK